MLTRRNKPPIGTDETIIGSGVSLIGNLEDKGPISIYGRAKGEITSNESIFVGDSAQIEGPLKARKITVAGNAIGQIDAEDKLDIASSGVVEGRIKTNNLTIESGAIFIGESDMNQAKEERMKATREEVVEPPIASQPEDTSMTKEEKFNKKQISKIYEVEE